MSKVEPRTTRHAWSMQFLLRTQGHILILLLASVPSASQAQLIPIPNEEPVENSTRLRKVVNGQIEKAPSLEHAKFFWPIRNSEMGDLFYAGESRWFDTSSLLLSSNKGMATSDIVALHGGPLRVSLGSLVSAASSADPQEGPPEQGNDGTGDQANSSDSPTEQDQAAAAQRLLTGGGTVYLTGSVPLLYKLLPDTFVVACSLYSTFSFSYEGLGATKTTSVSLASGLETTMGLRLIDNKQNGPLTAWLFLSWRQSGVLGNPGYYSDIGFNGPFNFGVVSFGLRVNNMIQVSILKPVLTHRSIRDSMDWTISLSFSPRGSGED